MNEMIRGINRQGRWAAKGYRAFMPVMLVLALMLPGTGVRAAEYTAHPGDVLDILVIGQPDLSRIVTVTLEGNVFLPLVGNVNVTDLTVKQIEKKLGETLSRFIKDPKVMVTFRQGSQEQVVFALGQAARPGAYPYRWGTTIGELLAECGGAGPHAALHRALVLQGTKAEPVDLDKLLKGDTSQNRPLHPGDVLLIPEITDRVLVLGQVAHPGYQDLKDDMRLIDAVTEAGPQLTASPERITVMREGQIVKSDLEGFLRKANLEQNVKLQAGDVVFVPETNRRILVMGEVVHPGPITMSDEFPKTVMDAIGAAGGPNRGAKMSDVTVVRHEGTGKSKEIHVNLDRFIHQGAADQNIALQPLDVIYVPAGFGLKFAEFMGTLSNLAVLKFLLGAP